MRTSFFSVMTVVLLSALVVVSAGATEVVLRDGMIIAEGLNDEHGLGAFNIVLVYGPGVSFEMGEWMQPYSGAINIQNQDGITRIGGLTISSEAQNGDIPLLRLAVNGSGPVAIYVNELYNAIGDPITTVNQPYDEGQTEPVSGDVTPTPVITVVTTGPVATTSESGGPISGSSEQSEVPGTAGEPAQTQGSQGREPVATEAPEGAISTLEDVTQISEGPSAATTEPVKSPLGFTFVFVSLFISFIAFQRIYMKRE